jgi:hypothetical protein
MRPSPIAIVVAAGVTGAVIMRNAQVRDALRREAELLGLRAYLAAVDRGASHGSFVADVRKSDCSAGGEWLVWAYGPGGAQDEPDRVGVA